MKTRKDLNLNERKSIYLDNWRESLIPLCENRPYSSIHLCSDFKPSLSNRGMCFTTNLAPVYDIYRPTPYIKTLNETFMLGREESPILKNMGSGMRYKNTFLIDAGRVFNLKRGLKWSETKRALFHVGVHQNTDMPEVRDTSIEVYSGYKTTIRVNAVQLESNPKIILMRNLAKRNCKFEAESDGLYMFKTYSRYIHMSYCNRSTSH